MSGNFFGDDDDFELTPGGDDSVPVAPQRQSTERPAVRPATPQQRPAGNLPVPPSANRNTLPRRPRPTGSAAPTPTVTTPAVPPARQSTLPSRTPRPQPSPPVKETPLEVQQPAPEQVKAPEPVYTPEPIVYAEEKIEEKKAQPVYEPEPVYTPEPDYPAVATYSEPEIEKEYDAPRNRKVSESAPRATISQTRINPTQDSGFSNASSYDNEFDSFEPSPAKNKNPHNNHENTFDNEEEDVKPAKGRTNSRNSKTRKGSTARKPKGKKEGPGAFAGGRRSVLITRVIAGAVVLGVMGTGINSIVNPPRIPTKPAITQLVRGDLNITKFPTENGNAFVSAFTKEYLTFAPDQRSNKTDALKLFTTDALASSLTGASGPELKQTVTESPVVSGVRSLDDNNAVYTVGAKVETGWVYLDIPVYYDHDLNSFSISGTPAFVAPPVKPEKIPSVVAPYSNDTTLVNSIEEDISNFFKVWSESNEDEIKRYINIEEADVETKSGLQKSVLYVEVSQLQVEKKDEESPEFNTRRAQAKVVWANPTAPKITYEQNYDLVLKLGDQDRWYVADITGGVRASGVGT